MQRILESTKQLVLLRHGESQWSRASCHTGWTDDKLAERARAESIVALNIPATLPLAYELTDEPTPLRSYCLPAPERTVGAAAAPLNAAR
jgi:bisphosphoglycerate-dependent phosphoglycerate mutase